MNQKKYTIKKNGITKYIPDEMKYFSQFDFNQRIDIPSSLPELSEVVSVIITPRIIALKHIETKGGKSFDGENLSDCKVLLEVELSQRIMYVADNSQSSMHVIQSKSKKIAYIDIPTIIEGTKTELLIKDERFRTNILIQDIVINRTNPRSILTTSFFILEVKYIPTYQVCVCGNHNSKGSDLDICFDNGRYYKKLTEEYFSNIILPYWSPSGQDIAFLSKKDDKYMLYYININNDIPIRITNPSMFESITSYCWNNNGDKIYFSGIKEGEKDIYSIDIRGQSCERITYGEDLVKSYKPRCSHSGEKIAFTRSLLGEKRLYIMDNNGLDQQQITSFGKVKDYDWSLFDKSIVYIIEEDFIKYSLYIVNMNTYERESIKTPDGLVTLRKVRFSPSSNYITYIGRQEIMDDIYLYDIRKRITINLTKYMSNKSISDYVWKTDQKKIYYSANNLGHFNAYILDMENDSITQMTSSNYSDVSLSYRPKII